MYLSIYLSLSLSLSQTAATQRMHTYYYIVDIYVYMFIKHMLLCTSILLTFLLPSAFNLQLLLHLIPKL